MTDYLVAEAAVRRLHACYADAVYRRDFDGFADCFAEDAEWRIAGLVLHGRVEIRQAIEQILARFTHVFMTFRSPILEVGDGKASGRTYVSEQSVFTDGRSFAPIGLYYEHFVNQGDRWRFQWRLFQTVYAGPPDLSGEFFDMPDYGPPPAMPPRDAVTVSRAGFKKD